MQNWELGRGRGKVIKLRLLALSAVDWKLGEIELYITLGGVIRGWME